MDIFENLNESENTTQELMPLTKTYTRIFDSAEAKERRSVILDSTDTEVRKEIDWNVTQEINILEIKNNSPHFLVYSKPALYASDYEWPKVIDVCVESKEKDLALEQFEKVKKESDIIKLEREKEIQPYLLEITKIPGVAFLSGRGTIYDSRRIARIRDDVDVSCFLEFASDEELKQILNEVEKIYQRMATELRTEVEGIKFFDKKYISNGSAEALVQVRNSRFTTSFDFIPYQLINIPGAVEVIKKQSYTSDMLQHSVFLAGDENKFNKMVSTIS